jgi:rfaE bifunctional protein nucleotidyltransferase chain/domain/rfaE bifunctional protein kinase chain/domain
MTGPIVVLGDALLDCDLVGSSERLAPDAPVPVIDDITQTCRPGGAGLAALLAARDGHEVILITALGDDGAGHELFRLLSTEGVEVRAGRLSGPTPEKVRIRAGGHAVARLDYGGRPAPMSATWNREIGSVIAAATGLLISDYGRGVASHPDVAAAIAALIGRGSRRTVWDPHPRGGSPHAGIGLVTPNRTEAGLNAQAGIAEVVARARELRTRWQVDAVAVTVGQHGAVFIDRDNVPLAVPATVASRVDPCGAGDRFATTAVAALAGGALPSEAVVAAVARASSFLAAGGVAGLGSMPPDRSVVDDADAASLAARVRGSGGIVVATGGCFDLIHAGHVRLLQSARTLGDCLIVCLNSDASVARLKGPGRPLQPAADRADVLLALGCVDAVAVFDEDTPERVLTDLRPHLFAKGADYTLARLPEADVVATWGGQAVVLPYLEGRSTTRLVKEAARHA